MSATSSVAALHAPSNPKYQYHSTYDTKGRKVPKNMMIIRSEDQNELHGYNGASEGERNYLSKQFKEEYEERIFNQDHPRIRDAEAAEAERVRNEEALALFSRRDGPEPEVVTKVVDFDAMTEAQQQKMFIENQQLQERRSHYGRKGFGLLEKRSSAATGSTTYLAPTGSRLAAVAPPAIMRPKESEADPSVVDIKVANNKGGESAQVN